MLDREQGYGIVHLKLNVFLNGRLCTLSVVKMLIRTSLGTFLQKFSCCSRSLIKFLLKESMTWTVCHLLIYGFDS